MKRSLAVLLVLGSCLQSHDDSRVQVRQEDCVTCHLVDYDGTTEPPHTAAPTATGTVEFPKTCADCHKTTSWKPALGGLHPPPPQFPIANGAPHVDIACLTCHVDLNTTAVAGANTDCVQCHPDDRTQRDSHAGVKSPQGASYAYTPDVRNFCLTCHPAGLAKKHPRDQFPLTGPHDAPCLECHDRASGLPDMDGMNTTCIASGCHSLSEEDRHHREEGGTRYTQLRGDGSNRHFCLDSRCHPDGRKHD